ncbi:xylan glycosyltransferase MUCI21-like isoform X2 [Diospyros lotus]|nr:xylan glycosyltransferase MUCI21-like isoform X2 [Diospyros lotus]
MASAARLISKKKDQKTLAICLVPLLIFFALDIILTMIFGSFDPNPTRIEDFDVEDDEEGSWESPEPTWSITCDRSHFEYDLCYINRPFLLDPTAGILYAVDPTNSTPPLVEKIRPYPRKWQQDAMEKVKELTLSATPPNSRCAVSHSSPALVFSAGGFSPNVFHTFNEGFIPLFITVDSLFRNRDVILVMIDGSDRWIEKYGDLFPRFTRHPIINLDKETVVHCFPSAVVGLISHGQMTIDPTIQRGPKPKTILDFTAVLEATYGEIRRRAWRKPSRPRLVWMSRSHHRLVLNEKDVVRAAKNIGFDVVVFEPTEATPMREIFRVIHSCHAMAGVHGAGLTYELFLRPGAVMMQIVPIRNSWLGDICYGKVAIRLGLEYIVYDVAIEESSLGGTYPREMLDPNDQGGMLTNEGWHSWDIYMNQNVTLDMAKITR